MTRSEAAELLERLDQAAAECGPEPAVGDLQDVRPAEVLPLLRAGRACLVSRGVVRELIGLLRQEH